MDYEGLFREYSDELIEYVLSRFPGVDEHEIVRDVLERVAQSINDQGVLVDKDGIPVSNVRGYLRTFVRNAALNAKRKQNRQRELLEIDALVEEGQASERRRRQGGTLSDVYRAFVRACEQETTTVVRDGRKVTKGAFAKEIFERRMADEPLQFIIDSMRLRQPKTIYREMKWAGEEIRKTMRSYDVDETLFLTVWNRDDVSLPEPHDPGPPPELSQRGKEIADSMPSPDRFEAVARWIMDETDALCPSTSRLKDYARDPGNEQLSDVRYHVEVRGCVWCRAILED